MWRGDESPFRGQHYQLERPLNHPPALTEPHPPIMIGGSGERKTLRLVARYAQACNLFAGPELARKLDVLRAHCEAEGRDYDEIEKTCYFRSTSASAASGRARCTTSWPGWRSWAFDMAIGGVADVWSLAPLEVIGSEVIPAVAGL